MRRFLVRSSPAVALGFVVLGGAFLGTACLGRTGVSDDDLAALGAIDPADGGSETSTDASIDTTVPDTFTPTDAPKPDAGPDRFIDIWEVLPIPDGGPIGDCLGCVRDKCGSSVNACINDAKCRSGLACTVTNCLTGGGGGGGGGLGGFDFACVTKCFDGDLKAAGTAISTFTCLLGTCGGKCGGLLGGGLPGGGGGGLPGGKGLPPAPAFGARPSQGLTAEQFLALPKGSTFYFYPEALSPWSEQLHETACAEKMISCAP